MKMKCSVIQDLLPSYVDQICSEDTQKLVKEHVAECASCRAKLERMKDTGIIADEAEDKQIDYLKKVRSSITHQELLGKLLLAILVGITFVGLFVGGGGLINYMRISSVIFSILFFCAAGLARNYRVSGKKQAVMAGAGISGVVFLFVVAINEYFIQSLVKNGKIPFSFWKMDLFEVGPFYARILRIAALIVIILLLYYTFTTQKNAYAVIWNITALSHIAYANELLYHMDTPASCLQITHRLAISQSVLAVLGIVIYIMAQKFKMSGIDNGM